jgi:hypothetical protein
MEVWKVIPGRHHSKQDHSSLGNEVLRRVLVKYDPTTLPGNALCHFLCSMAREYQLLLQDLELECALVGSRKEDQKFSRSYQISCQSVIF